MPRLLILGGTAEAADLAERAVLLPGLDVTTSLAGRTRAPRPLPGRVRTGGFGGAAGLAAFIETERIDLVIDATHPFAATIAANAALACAETARPRLRLLRPPWPRHPDDRWHETADAFEAARLLPALGRRRPLLTLGHRDLAAFAALAGARPVVRTIEPPASPPLANALHLTARGPFTLADELALFRAHAIDALVTKASGGAATYAKIEAARLLGLPVLMLRRPDPPAGPTVPAVAPALAWLAARLGTEPGACPDCARGPKEGQGSPQQGKPPP